MKIHFFSLRQNVEQLTSSSGPARAIIADIRKPPDVRYGQKFSQPCGLFETGTAQLSVTQMFQQGTFLDYVDTHISTVT